jgi:hypothetical protein
MDHNNDRSVIAREAKDKVLDMLKKVSLTSYGYAY